jgi:outer membrane protein assembly factor BamB
MRKEMHFFSKSQFRSMMMLGLVGISNITAVQADGPGKVQDGLQVSDSDWPWWRGPHRNGEAASNQSPPVAWDDSTNVAWKTAIPGRGYGSVCLHGDKAFLLTSDESSGSQSVLCLDRQTGKVLWTKVVHAQGGMRKNAKSTSASSTPACDGSNLFVCFPNQDGLWVSALDLAGSIVWQKKISAYVEHQGFGSSPALYQSLVIAASDNKAGGVIVGLDRKTGETVWQHDRPKMPNYPSPILIHAFGKDQMIMTGCDLVTSLDHMTGKTNWQTAGATTECVTSTLTDGQRIFTSGGYPRNHMSAVTADGSSKLVWENDVRLYVPSPLFRNGTLYAVLDAGIAAAWDSATGKELWRQRLGGTFSSSPILVGENIYATNEVGETFIYKADPKGYQLVGKNQLGGEVFATPVLCNSKIYYRCSREVDGKRQEFLYCLASGAKQ